LRRHEKKKWWEAIDDIHAWWDVMEIGSKPFMDVVIASYVDGYNDTSTTYRIDIPVQWGTMVSRDVIFGEDVRSSSSQDSPSLIEEIVEVVCSRDQFKDLR
jgi:hypothetical protein